MIKHTELKDISKRVYIVKINLSIIRVKYHHKCQINNSVVIKIKKIRLDVSSESSAKQRIHMKNQVLFSSKNKSKKLKCRLLQFLFDTLMVKD